MEETTEKFCCAGVCMDGRANDAIGEPTQEAARKIEGEGNSEFYVDRVTEAGIVAFLADPDKNERYRIKVESIKERFEVSVVHHHSKIITLSGHDKCKGNPVPKETQIQQLWEAKKTVEEFPFVKDAKVKIMLFWIEKVGKKWVATEVK